MLSKNTYKIRPFLFRFAALFLLVMLIAVTTGSLVALFLWLLQWATDYRQAHAWLLFLLPLAGVAIYALYRFWGKNSEKGNNLIIDELHQPGGGVPARMAPLVLAGTIITHLFGGSAGREGTAVQMGGSIASYYSRWFRLFSDDVRIALCAGIAAGFGAVFGTPVAGAVFAVEVLAIGDTRYDALLPCFIAAILSDMTTTAWGIHHTHYAITSALRNGSTPWLHIDPILSLKVAIAGCLFGLAGRLFSGTAHTLKSLFNAIIPWPWLTPVIGGCLVITICYFLGTTDYIGLGVTGPHADSVNIMNAFHAGGATYFSWLWKLLLTAVTLSTGFKGGEVTPLFFIGATLGNVIAAMSGGPIDLFAALGFIAIFAAATNTPIACTIMGAELFGSAYSPYYAIACFMAYYLSGHTGIYTSQRVAIHKLKRYKIDDRTIGDIHKEKEKRSRDLIAKWLSNLHSKK